MPCCNADENTEMPCVASMSASRHPNTRVGLPQFWISVVLDPKLCQMFSHVRLMIVHEDIPGLEDLCIDNFNGISNPGATRPSAHLRAEESRRRHSHTSFRNAQLRTTCTVVLKLSLDPVDLPWGSKKALMTLLTTLRSDPHAPRIAYDATCPITPSSDTTYLSLQNAHYWKLNGDDYFAHANAKFDNWYQIHISQPTKSLSSSPSLAQTLPRDIVNRIVCNVTYNTNNYLADYDGLPHILSYALVCKGWYHTLDIYWHVIAGVDEYARHANTQKLSSVVHSLEFQPHRAQLIEMFDYTGWELDDDFDQTLDTIWRLLNVVAEHLVWLLCIPHDVVALLCDVGFPRLQHLEALHIRGYLDERGSAEYPNAQQSSVLEIQELAKECPALDTIWLVGLEGNQPRFHEGPVGPPPSYILQHLAIENYGINGPQLSHFIHGPTPALRSLKLVDATGLTNSDISDVLYMTRQTLTSLTIRDCDIQSPSAGEELAFDANIAKMEVLEKAHLSGDLASIAALLRKPKPMIGGNRRRDMSGGKGFSFQYHAPSRFFCSATTSLAEVMRHTNWIRVSLDFSQPDGSHISSRAMEDEVRLAGQVAHQRGDVEFDVKW